MEDEDIALRVQVTGAWLLEHGLWIEAARMLDINEWAINEGRMDRADWVSLTEVQARELGILRTASQW